MTTQAVVYLSDAKEGDPIDLRTILQSALQSGLPGPFSFRMVPDLDKRSIETSIERGKKRAESRIASQLKNGDGKATTVVVLIPLIEFCDWRFTFRILAVAGNGRNVGYTATKTVAMPSTFGSKQRGMVWRREKTLGEALDAALYAYPRQFAYLCKRGPLCGLSDGKFSDQRELIEAISAAVSQLA